MKYKSVYNLVITVICVILTIALFIFFTNSYSESPNKESLRNQECITEYSFSYDPELLVYDGTGKLDLLKGVSVTSSDGENCTDRTIASILPSDNVNEKKIIYTVYNTDGSTVTSERKLILKGYRQPEISFSGAGKEFRSSDPDQLMKDFISQGLISASDGYGREISKYATVIVISASESGICSITVSVENFLGDTVSVRSSVIIK